MHPIRIAAHAFGQNRPARDLVVSPGHAICVDVLGEVLIPAGALVNGATVQQIEVDEVTYWHVELDSHDIILAENLPAESYIDCGNRSFFEEADVVALDASPDARPATTADYCRRFVGDGPLVEAVRAQLRARAEKAGWRRRDDARGGLALEVDGVRIEPAWQDLSACFALPPGARDVWLVSTAARPSDLGDGADTRLLGVSLQSIAVLDGFTTTAVALDDPRLGDGFHEPEAGWRWTDGRALLPVALLVGETAGPMLLRIDLAGPALPRWVGPRTDALDERTPPLRLVS